MQTYWIAAKRPMGSKTWTIHPEAVISRRHSVAREKLANIVDVPEMQYALAMCHVPENQTDGMLLETGAGA